MKRDIIRRCIFRPYRKGMGPTFSLIMWDTHRTMDGKSRLGYRLTMQCRDHYSSEPLGRSAVKVRDGWRNVVLFEGEDLGCSPMHAIDSDESVEACMGFLTLRPGDTDRDWFDAYTPEQMEYCQQHAEALGAEVQARFCDENGRVRKRGAKMHAKQHTPIPKDWPVQPLKSLDGATSAATCGYCGLSWDDGIVTSMTPTPSARCPFESFHRGDA